MDKKPICPYCGEWNGHPNGVEMVGDEEFVRGDPSCFEYFAKCPSCGSRGPISCEFDVTTPVYRGWQDANRRYALADAIHRFRTMQKPLILEEARSCDDEDYLWIEYSYGYIECVKIRGLDPATGYVSIWKFGYEHSIGESMKNYGVKWRLWKDKPTDEERDDAQWKQQE